MKKLLSYLWPFSKKVSSRVNGTLEITWMNGKKVLDSKNANYSYGTLQKLLSYGLSKIEIPPKSEILLLGLGGGSIVYSLRNTFKHQGNITAIEIDPVIIDIAQNEFHINDIDNLKIVCEDAMSYIVSCQDQFEIIIIDIFIDNRVPDSFYAIPFWEEVISVLQPKGNIVFNAGINLKDTKKIESLKSKLKAQIEFVQFDGVQKFNTLLIGKKL